ncbi:polyketide cyclase/dehydrase/lipid transport protein [Jatrophihabitans sp. GAS493]|uniref:SRPBCC family protein n=1 Tax=Jatrophihabitans sp. GAS493 TaxID=1907575 RepID=UPI000BC0D12D|nr:SRPBCC family protein [Jatrophihabitans sp. GAS493]SOD72204.1 polyketide cyclase/dehydrase/lipid transport protein [Jatrophihabitans sp. GAS493]
MSRTGPGMTEVSVTVNATAERVFAELSDGWAYAGWVVGATHIRDVDPGWPARGNKIHHKIGSWPVVLTDDTESLECVPNMRLVLRARGWPLGEATVDIVVEAESPDRTRVTLGEAPTGGPGKWLDNPGFRWGLRARNVESLRRLKDRVEHRHLTTGQ